MNVKNAVAVVTGGASGIGFGIAEALVHEGAQVVIADIEESALRDAAEQLGAIPFRVDVTDAQSVQSLADFVSEKFGRVDIVVNNAGVGPVGRIDELTLEDWKWVLDVNLWGVIHGVHAFLPLLQANPEGGHFVNTGSMASFIPTERIGPYSVSKFGVAALTEVLNAEMKTSGSLVRATLLAPGPVRSNIQTSTRNRPAEQSGALKDIDSSNSVASGERWATPKEVGEFVVRAIVAGDAYALTHPDWFERVEARSESIKAAFGKYPLAESGE